MRLEELLTIFPLSPESKRLSSTAGAFAFLGPET